VKQTSFIIHCPDCKLRAVFRGHGISLQSAWLLSHRVALRRQPWRSCSRSNGVTLECACRIFHVQGQPPISFPAGRIRPSDRERSSEPYSFAGHRRAARIVDAEFAPDHAHHRAPDRRIAVFPRDGPDGVEQPACGRGKPAGHRTQLIDGKLSMESPCKLASDATNSLKVCLPRSPMKKARPPSPRSRAHSTASTTLSTWQVAKGSRRDQ
jgi:hypothetical protein